MILLRMGSASFLADYVQLFVRDERVKSDISIAVGPVLFFFLDQQTSRSPMRLEARAIVV
jgi:hypothetical protein